MSPIPSPLPPSCGLIAILRGLRPEEALPIGTALYAAGLRLIEVPLPSPAALDSIAALHAGLPGDCVIGAGTVLRPADCAAIRDAGGRCVVMPHADAAVIGAAKAAGLVCLAGVATPTEAFAALAAGADGLKLFPAEQLGVAVLRAWRAVLPPPVALIPVGSITPESIAAYARAGASGFGLGSALYQPGRGVDEVAARARQFVQAWRDAYPDHPSQETLS